MASISFRPSKKDKTFNFLIAIENGLNRDGSRKRETCIFKSTAPTKAKAKKEAEIFAEELERKKLQKEIISGDIISFDEFVKKWEENWLIKLTQKVQENYLDNIRLHVSPYIGKKMLSRITTNEIDRIIKQLLKEGFASSTVHTVFTVINSVMKYAYKKKYISENPCDFCDELPSVQLKNVDDLHFFTPEQAKFFLNEVLTKEYQVKRKGHIRALKNTGKEYTVDEYESTISISYQWRVYFTIALYSGFRRSEMCALTWEDISFKTNSIKITKALSETKKKGTIVKDPKTHAGKREIILPPICFEMLKKWKLHSMYECRCLGSKWLGHRDQILPNKKKDYFELNTVFTQACGLPMSLSSPSHKFHEILLMYNESCENEEDKLPMIRLHDLRHTSVTALLSENTDIETVAKRAGHSKPSVTLNIYGHCIPENDKKASAKLDNLFNTDNEMKAE